MSWTASQRQFALMPPTSLNLLPMALQPAPWGPRGRWLQSRGCAMFSHSTRFPLIFSAILSYPQNNSSALRKHLPRKVFCNGAVYRRQCYPLVRQLHAVLPAGSGPSQERQLPPGGNPSRSAQVESIGPDQVRLAWHISTFGRRSPCSASPVMSCAACRLAARPLARRCAAFAHRFNQHVCLQHVFHSSSGWRRFPYTAINDR